MESKKAANILINLLKRYSLEPEEKEAVLSAIGALSWFLLAENKIKKLKNKKDKNADK
jgi:hypothetical protein